ncbi:competence protein ComK [Sporosarcina sp. E16_8]|uniref:competence protein ComK n=1 Tax=Sporosarcina sp. E16_8 TaxID=2789295 RepID=UPI001A936620|nr:competence protein ComK [Sporosarcina sp. E16_8]MBO0589489.1 competence protein ComK [Sporosarcina sp. E16_8]
MVNLTNYVITYSTILFLPRYESGNLFTTVLDNSSPFVVELEPTALIDLSLKYYGSSLRGAGDGANMILGKGKMYPVIVNEKLDLYWFPSKSPLKCDCIWFALHHIEETIELPNKRTQIIFSDGSTITIAISKMSFDKKIQIAYKLKGKLESRTRGTPMHVSESRGLYHIAKNEKEINFNVIAQCQE